MSSWFASATLWDWVIGLVCFLSVLFGLWRGFVRTAFGLAAWVLAFLFTPLVAGLLAPVVQGLSMPAVVLQILVFIALFILCRVAGALVGRAIRSVGLGGLDRFFGALLGAARAAVMLMVLAMVAARLGMAAEPSWRHAHARPFLDGLVESGFKLLEQLPSPVSS